MEIRLSETTKDRVFDFDGTFVRVDEVAGAQVIDTAERSITGVRITTSGHSGYFVKVFIKGGETIQLPAESKDDAETMVRHIATFL